MKKLTSALLALTLLAGSAVPALAAPCKDAKGKFIKCPPKTAAKPAAAPAAKPAAVTAAKPAAKPATTAAAKPAAPKKGPCRDAKGRFAKCK